MNLLHPVPCDFITKDKVNEFLKKRVKDSPARRTSAPRNWSSGSSGSFPRISTWPRPPWTCSPNRPRRTTITTARSCSSPRPRHRSRRSRAGPRTGARPGRPASPGALHPPGTEKRRRLDGAPGGHGRPGHLANVGVHGARWPFAAGIARGRSRSGSGDAGAGQYPVFESEPLYLRKALVFPYTEGMMFQDAGAAPRRPERLCRGLPARALSPRSRSFTRTMYFDALSRPIRNFPHPPLPPGAPGPDPRFAGRSSNTTF